MQNSKSIKVNSILNIVKTISSIIFPLITFPYTSRVLGPANIGKVNFGNSFINYFSLLASLGISTYAIRECSAARKSKSNLSKTASELFSINMCTTVIAYVLLGITLLFFRKLDSYRTIIIIQSTAILFATWGADWLNSAMEDFSYITIRTISFQVISVILLFLFVREADDYMKYVIISIVSTSGANIANIYYRKKYCDVRFTLKMRLNIHLKPIMLLFVMLMAQTIFNSVDITMLGLIKGDVEVGLYSTALKMKNIVVQVVASLCWVVMPRMSLYFAEDNWEKINEMLKKVLSVMVTIGFPSIAGCVILSKEIIVLIGGNKFIDASLPLIILMLSFLVDIFGGSFLGNMVCLPGKRESVFMVACSVAAVVNVILNYLLIPIGGASAAAFTSGLSAVVILIWLLVKKDRRVKLDYVFEVCKAPLIGSILIMVFCLIIKKLIENSILQIFVCLSGSVAIYGLIQIIMKNMLVTMVLGSIKEKLQKRI
ncbi:MAG: flippase [Clostridia bacterium]|nr:flippase [Clostridia bacterium]